MLCLDLPVLRGSILTLTLLLWGCGPAVSGAPVPVVDGPEPGAAAAPMSFDVMLDAVVLDQPAICRSLGYRDRCDGKVFDYSAANIEKRITLLKRIETQLAAMPAPRSDNEALDHKLLDQTVQEELFSLVELESWRRRPNFYEELFSVDSYFTRDYAPFEERVRRYVKHVEAALPQTKNIIANLRGPLPESFVSTDLGIYKGYAEYLRGDVVKLLAEVNDPKLREQAIDLSKKLAAAADTVANHLETVEKPRADQSHKLGVEKYKKLLMAQEALSMPLDAFEQMAEADLQRNKQAYEALLVKTKPSRPAIPKLLDAATKITFDAKAFIEKKGLMTVPDEGQISVKETPLFMRYNSAFLDGPGPFDRPDLSSYYYITPPDPTWPAKEQEEYVMTWGSLMATTVHEAFPGHFLQGLWIRRAPSRAQKMISSYSFVEGWAHYTEQLMVEEGFGADDPQNKLGQLNDALLRNCRFVVSIGMHTKDMTLQQAEDRFVKDCHQDRANARQQAYRGTFDPGYFAYTLGKLQILALREEAKKALGDDFNIKRFHDALLAHGSPQVPLIRERVLHDLGVR